MMTIEYSWKDDFLKYSHLEDYSDLDFILIRNSQVWIPTIYLMNSASDKFSYNPPPNDLAELYTGGFVSAWLFTFFTVGCSLDLRKFALFSALKFLISFNLTLLQIY